MSVEIDGEHQLLMLDGTRIIVPSAARSAVISGLHTAHSGMTKMYSTARQLYFWPGMKGEIQAQVNNCATCQRFLPTQPRPTLSSVLPSAALGPMHHVAMDLFDADAKKWLVMVDRYSGYTWLQQLQKTTTAKIISCLLYTSPSPRDGLLSRMPSSA